MSYQSANSSGEEGSTDRKVCVPLREKGSTTFFLMPFLPLDKRLFYHDRTLLISELGGTLLRDAPFLRP
jgi:hypothetical protein